MSSKKNNTRKRNVNNLLWLFLSIFVVANVYLSIDSAANGAEISYLEGQERRINDEKNFLSEQLLKTASLKQAEQRANELGFAKPASIVYLNGEESVAKLP